MNSLKTESSEEKKKIKIKNEFIEQQLCKNFVGGKTKKTKAPNEGLL